MKSIFLSTLFMLSLPLHAQVITCEAIENQFIQSGEVTVRITGKKATLRSRFDNFVINRDDCRVVENRTASATVICKAIEGDSRILHLHLKGQGESYIAENSSGMYMASLVCDN